VLVKSSERTGELDETVWAFGVLLFTLSSLKNAPRQGQMPNPSEAASTPQGRPKTFHSVALFAVIWRMYYWKPFSTGGNAVALIGTTAGRASLESVKQKPKTGIAAVTANDDYRP